MEEKRHHKRLKLDVSIQLERLTEDGTTTYDYTQVVVTDVSRGGIGFQSDEPLEVGGYYNTRNPDMDERGDRCSHRGSCVSRKWKMEPTNMGQLLLECRIQMQ